jgi:hypothetical protein
MKPVNINELVSDILALDHRNTCGHRNWQTTAGDGRAKARRSCNLVTKPRNGRNRATRFCYNTALGSGQWVRLSVIDQGRLL